MKGNPADPYPFHRPRQSEYVIYAESRSHPQKRLYFTKSKFSDHGSPARFPSESSARKAVKWLRDQFSILRRYRLEVIAVNPIGLLAGLQAASATKSLTERRSNPQRRQLLRAGRLLKDFSGHAPSEVLRLNHEPIREGLVIGTLDAVPYTTVRDGRTERYIHEFSKRARPLLVASSDGRRLGIVGGRFQFTEAGIIDD